MQKSIDILESGSKKVKGTQRSLQSGFKGAEGLWGSLRVYKGL